mgnify:CR=1 FL=1
MSKAEDTQEQIMLAICDTYLKPATDYTTKQDLWDACKQVALATDNVCKRLDLRWYGNILRQPTGQVYRKHYKTTLEEMEKFIHEVL